MVRTYFKIPPGAGLMPANVRPTFRVIRKNEPGYPVSALCKISPPPNEEEEKEDRNAGGDTCQKELGQVEEAEEEDEISDEGSNDFPNLFKTCKRFSEKVGWLDRWVVR